ncbi:hypothetical protein JCM8547_002158 [Rhodosporidiobolus lusitaniae]
MQHTPAATPPPPAASGSTSSSAASPAWWSTPDAKPVLYLATHIHPVSRDLANSLFDVIDDKDPRYSTWYEYADAAVLRIGRITDEEARKAKKLRIIARNGVGYESVPLEACKDLGIMATNQPGSNDTAVAEAALGLTISVARRMTELDRRMRRGEHLPNITVLAETVEGRTVGLVGMGDIAYATAKKFWGAYDSPILVYSPTSSPYKWTERDPNGKKPIPHRRVSSLEELLREADIVSLHCPLYAETEKMMSTEQFKMMKKSAILINTARGGLIDEPALYEALTTGEIYGAGLDVFCTEPATTKDYGHFFALENVVVGPHLGGGTHRVQIKSCNVAVETCVSWLKGECIGESNALV